MEAIRMMEEIKTNLRAASLVVAVLAALVSGALASGVARAQQTGYTISALELPAGGVASGATGVNEAGQVSGAYSDPAIPFLSEAVFWTNGTSQRITEGTATGINNGGQVVGISGNIFSP